MQPYLKPDLKYTHSFVIPVSKTVPSLYPESNEFIQMSEVFATGFLVGVEERKRVFEFEAHGGLDLISPWSPRVLYYQQREIRTTPGQETTVPYQ
jgi:fluoroacetyl-CoA thioesterase